MKRWLSYLWPLTTRISTSKNKTLELTTWLGKTVLDSAHVNYSYGRLQQALKFGMNQVGVGEDDSVLLLGLGGGSAVQTLRTDFHTQGTVTAVDFDPDVIDIAMNEFGLADDNHLEVICADAFNFVKEIHQQFNLIIVDLYVDNAIPGKVYTFQFWDNIIGLLHDEGKFIFNAALNSSKKEQLQLLSHHLEPEIETSFFNNVAGTNMLMTGIKRH